MAESEAIHIRPYVVADARSLFEAARESVDTVGLWQSWCTPEFSLRTAQAWVEAQVLAFQSQTQFEFVICDGEGLYLGGCGLNRLDWANATANLGYWVRASSVGHGVATEAARQLARWGFDNTGLRRLELLVALGNLPSLRVAVKLGTGREGLLRQGLLVHGAPHDAVLFSLLRSEQRHD
jgi:RimJ/RimL family protein N-acetyltransferase